MDAVRTPMLDLAMKEPAAAALRAGGLLGPEDGAEAVVAGICEECFLILPHQDVAKFMAGKATNPERWLVGMRRIVRHANTAEGAPS